jgi:hypothetical protein
MVIIDMILIGRGQVNFMVQGLKLEVGALFLCALFNKGSHISPLLTTPACKVKCVQIIG